MQTTPIINTSFFHELLGEASPELHLEVVNICFQSSCNCSFDQARQPPMTRGAVCVHTKELWNSYDDLLTSQVAFAAPKPTHHFSTARNIARTRPQRTFFGTLEISNHKLQTNLYRQDHVLMLVTQL